MLKKITALLCTLCLCIPTAAVFAEDSINDNNYNMVINESDVVRYVPREMYGRNCEWSVGINNNYFD